MTVASILLAAARADYAGQPLALAPWTEDETLIEWEAGQMLAAGVDVVEVVLGYEADRIIPLLSRENVEPIIDPAWQHDAASAVRVGATAVPRETHAALIIDITRPRPMIMLRALLEAHEAHGAPITRPRWNDRAGWPIIVGSDVLAQLRNARPGSDALVEAERAHLDATFFIDSIADAIGEIWNDDAYEPLREVLVPDGD